MNDRYNQALIDLKGGFAQMQRFCTFRFGKSHRITGLLKVNKVPVTVQPVLYHQALSYVITVSLKIRYVAA